MSAQPGPVLPSLDNLQDMTARVFVPVKGKHIPITGNVLAICTLLLHVSTGPAGKRQIEVHPGGGGRGGGRGGGGGGPQELVLERRCC